MSLNKILDKYNFWNSQFDWDNGTDKNTMHSYISHFYEEKFLKYKDNKIKLCEIGVWTGRSLMLWQKYFKKGSEIIGIENNVSHIHPEVYETKNISIINDDAYSADVVRKLPNLDIAIDDGPHTLDSQIKFLQLYYAKMKKNGIMVVEDVGSIENANILKDNLPIPLRDRLHIFDLRKVKNRGDDIIACLHV